MNLLPCPCCSFWSRRHPELSGDLIVRPMVRSVDPDRHYVTGACIHTRPAFGPHLSVEGAVRAWNDIALALVPTVNDDKQEDLRLWLEKEERYGLGNANPVEGRVVEEEFQLGTHPLLK